MKIKINKYSESFEINILINLVIFYMYYIIISKYLNKLIKVKFDKKMEPIYQIKILGY